MLFYKTEATAVSYGYFSNIYSNGSKFDINDVLDTKTEHLKQVFCIVDDKIYFCYVYNINNEKHCVLASINSIDSKFEILWDEVFNSTISWNYNYYDDYSLRAGYYYNGKIVVTDFDTLIEYDLKTEICNKIKFHKYQKPIMNLKIKKNNSQEYLLNFNDNTFFINDDFLINNSEVAKKILTKNKFSIWNGDSPADNFIDSIKIIDDRIFVICRIKNFSGTSYAIIFEINPEQQSCHYVGFHMVGGIIHDSEFYIVPKQSKDG